MTASTNFSENNAIQQHKQLLLNCKEYISSLVGLVACVVELQGIHSSLVGLVACVVEAVFSLVEAVITSVHFSFKVHLSVNTS